MSTTKPITPQTFIRNKTIPGLIMIILIMFISPLDACRLWATISLPGYTLFDSDNELNSGIRNELIEFQHQGGCRENSWPYNNHNGWAMVYYSDEGVFESTQLIRSALPAETDSITYNQFVSQMLSVESQSMIGLGHVRKASSGATDVPNPHPFIMTFNGKTYTMAHNGNVDKTVILNLITNNGTDFSWIDGHPPQTFGNGSWQEDEGWYYVVDSELIFLWIMKNIIEGDDDTFKGLHASLSMLELEHPYGKKNIIFSDGSDIYAYRSTISTTIDLFYSNATFVNPEINPMDYHYSVMSTPPQDGEASQLNWYPIDDEMLVKLSQDGIEEYANFPDYVIPPDEDGHIPQSIGLSNYPNPFNAATTIQFELQSMSHVTGQIFDLNGRFISEISNKILPSGTHQILWNPQNASAGIYLVKLEVENQKYSNKVIYLK